MEARKGMDHIKKEIIIINKIIAKDKEHVKEEPENPKEQSLSGKWAFKRIMTNTLLVDSLKYILKKLENL